MMKISPLELLLGAKYTLGSCWDAATHLQYFGRLELLSFSGHSWWQEPPTPHTRDILGAACNGSR
jgi:hypothetical protein